MIPVKYQRELDGLKVCCSNKEKGCDWTGTLDKLDVHLEPEQDQCQYVDTMCPLNCEQTVQKIKVEQHVKENCINRPYVCKYCGFKAIYNEVVEMHWPECEYVPLQCPNRCGVTCEREVIEDHMKMCRLEEVECEFNGVGCTDRFVRELEDEHVKEMSHGHLVMTAAALVRVNEELQKKIQTQEKKLLHQDKTFKYLLEEKLQEQKQIILKDKKTVTKSLHDQELKLKDLEEKLQEKEKQLQKQAEQASRLERWILKRTFKMENFDEEKNKGKGTIWKSPAMYTHVCGYEFCIEIWPNGFYGENVIVRLYVLPGEYDEELNWPAKVKLTLELVSKNKGENVIGLIDAQWGKPSMSGVAVGIFERKTDKSLYFVELSKINEFLHMDTLHFKLCSVELK